MRSQVSGSEPSSKWWATLGIGLGVLMFTLDTSIVNIALPTLVQAFNTSFATVQWVVLSYLLVIASLVLGAARLGDMIGKKRLYLSGLILFTLSSLLCGLATSVGWLIAFRALQGMGAVMISALGAALITEAFPSSERGKAMGIISAIVSLGIALGPTVGGLLLGLSGWRTLFLVNVPIGIFASLVVIRYIAPSGKNPVEEKFDAVGAFLMAATLLSFALGMTQGQQQGFTSSTALMLLAIAVIGFLCFLWVENRVKQPMLDLKLFRSMQFSLNLLTGLLVFMVVAGLIFLAPFFLELVMHYPTSRIGLLLAACPVLGGVIAPFSGTLSDRFGSRTISLVGLLLMALGCLSISTLDAQMTDLDFIIRVAPMGFGMGVFQSPNNSAVLGAVPPERLGIASGLLALTRMLGQAIGLPLGASLFGVLAFSHTPAIDVTSAPPEALVFGLQGTFRIAALILLLTTILAATVGRMERRSQVAKVSGSSLN